MATYVAFLRAINLGPTRKFGKDDQRRVTEEAGFDGVETYINTGNVRLETRMRSVDRIAERLEAAYRADRGFDVPTIVLSSAELARVAADVDEVAEGHDGVHYVSLLQAAPAADAVSELEARSTERERVVVRGRAAHLLLGENYHEARISNATVEKLLGVATSRNVTVVRKLAGKWC